MAERFLIASAFGDLAFAGNLLRAEGHDVALNIRKPEFQDCYRGILPHAAVYSTRPNTTVLIDTTGRYSLGAVLRGRGHAVIGGNQLERLETDRTAGISAARTLGIAVPETETFQSVKDAVRFLHHADGPYYFKPSGDVESDLTCPARTPQDMIRWIRWKDSKGAFQKVKDFLLQKEVEGTEIDCDGWYHPRTGWVWPFCSTVEDKKTWTGDLGASCGGSANVVFCWPSSLPPLAAATIARAGDLLGESNYIGNAAINMVIDDAGVPHFLEFTLRFGFPSTQAFFLLVENLGQQLAAFARGDLRRWELRDDDLALTLGVSVPPYPWEDPEVAAEQRGLPLDPRLDGSHPRVFPTDVMRQADGIVCSGGIGNLASVCAVGPHLHELRTSVLDLAKSLNIRGKQYRIDPVERFPRVLTALRDFGYDDGRFDEQEDAA